MFGIGVDELLTDADGSSRITIPHYAAGIVDWLENPAAPPADHLGLLAERPGRRSGQDMSTAAPPVDA